MKGLSQIIMVTVLLIFTLTTASLLYTYLATYTAAKTKTLELVDSYCVNNTASFVVRNGGSSTLTKSDLVCTNSPGCSSCVPDATFPSQGAGYVKAFNCSTGTHVFNLVGAGDTLQLVTYCQ